VQAALVVQPQAGMVTQEILVIRFGITFSDLSWSKETNRGN